MFAVCKSIMADDIIFPSIKLFRYLPVKEIHMDKSMQTEDRSIYKEIFSIGIPSFLETLFTTFASIIDSRMVSAMGLSAISAVSVTNQPRLFTLSIFFAINTVTSSLCAKYKGSQDRQTANIIFYTVLKTVIIFSIVLSALTVLLAEPIMIAFSGQADILDASSTYFRIVNCSSKMGQSLKTGDYPLVHLEYRRIFLYGKERNEIQQVYSRV